MAETSLPADTAAVGAERPKIKTPPAAWWALTVLFLFYAISLIDRVILAMLVQPIKADLGLTDTQMSLLLGPAFVFSFALVGIPLGWLADRTSRRWVLFFGVTLWSLAATAGGFARSFLGLFVARAGVGAGEASLQPAAYSLMGDLFPRERLALAIAIFQSGQKLGTAAAYSLGAILIQWAPLAVVGVPGLEDFHAWQLVLLFTGVPGIILALLIFTVSEPKRKPSDRKEAKDEGLWRFLRANLTLVLLLMGGFACIHVANSAVTAWTPAFIERQFAWHPLQYGPWLSMMSIATAASLLFKGVIMDWLYTRGMKDAHIRFYTWLCITAFPAAAAVFWLRDVHLFLVVYGALQVVTLTFLVFLTPAIQIFTPPTLRAQVTSVFLTAFSLAGAIGPVSVGLLTDSVLKDETKLGVSLAIVLTSAVFAAIVLLRLSLSYMRKLMTASEG